MVKCLYSVFAFLPILQCLCIHTVYIYIFYLLTLKLITIFKVPFTLWVPRGLGCLCSAPQPPSHTETYAAVKLKGKPGNQSHQNLNAVPHPSPVHCPPSPQTHQPNSSHTLPPVLSTVRRRSQQSAHEDSLFVTLRLTVAMVTYANVDKDGNSNGCRCLPWNNDDSVTVAKLAETWGQSPAKFTSEKGGVPTAWSSPAIVQSRAIRVNWSYI